MDRRMVWVGAILTVLAAVSVLLATVIDRDVPAEVSIDAAVSVVGQEQPAPPGAQDAAAGAVASTGQLRPVEATDDLDGMWVLVPGPSAPGLSEADGSFAGFRVKEELMTIGAFTAVGRTGDVEGTLEISDGQVTAVEVRAGLAGLRTDDPQRDSAVQRALRTAAHPDAVFALEEPLDVRGAVESGRPVSLQATGSLAVAGVTQPTVVEVDALFVDGVIVVVGSAEVVFADFGVSVPEVPIVLSAEDHGVLEFQLLFMRR